MNKEERTFVAIKPDAVKRGIIGRIIERFADKQGNTVYLGERECSIG